MGVPWMQNQDERRGFWGCLPIDVCLTSVDYHIYPVKDP